MQLETPVETIIKAAKIAKDGGAKVILNPAPATMLSNNVLKNVDYLTPNETELRILMGLAPDDPTPTLDLAQRLFSLGIRQIVVTRGSQGALIITPDGSEALPAVEITPVDPTGAGDCFNAALAVGLGEGLTLLEAVRQATHAGAYMATHLGVIDGLPTRAELDTFMVSHA